MAKPKAKPPVMVDETLVPRSETRKKAHTDITELLEFARRPLMAEVEECKLRLQAVQWILKDWKNGQQADDCMRRLADLLGEES
jgi:hypothetical protein